MAPDVEGGLFVLASVDGEPAAVAKFQLSDPEFWPAQPSGESTFIHRLAVRRRYARTGVSSALIDWAVERTRSIGRQYLRLDCDALRPRLRAFYERRGFIFQSEIEVGPHHVARYERRVDS